MANIPSGPDFFQTLDGDASFAFTNSTPIPEHFFGPGSKRFVGVIHFKGEPINSYTDPTGKTYDTGSADTVVLRAQDVTIEGNSGSGTTPIELVALSLVSTKAIEVDIGGKKHKWHVHATVSKKKRSTGTMTFRQTSSAVGDFTSELNVVPRFRFVGPGDEEKHFDAADREIPKEKAALVNQASTMVASGVAWEVAPQAGQATGSEARAVLAVEPVVHVAPTHFHSSQPVKGTEAQ